MSDYTRKLMYQIADHLGRSPTDLEPFIATLEKNWYNTKDSLQKLKIQDYDSLDIPRRVSALIMEKVGSPSIRPEKKQMSMMEMDIEISLPQLLESLKAKTTKHQNFNQLVDTIFRIFSNIRNSVIEEKYRTLKKNNKKISEILCYRECYEILKYGGFEDEEQLMMMTQVNLGRIDECLNEISKYHEGSKFDPYKAHVTSRNDKTRPMNEVEGETSYVFNEKLDQLVQYREKVMSKPIKDRNVKVYKNTNKEQFRHDDRDWFNERNQTEDERQYDVSIKEKLMHFGEDPKFMNKRKLEYYELAKKPIFSETLVRVKLPDNWIFECTFAPMEPLGELVNIFHEHLANPNVPYYLYMTPPVEKLRGPVLRQTFYEKGCVPRALFYFGSEAQIDGSTLMKQKKEKLFGIF